MMQCNKKNDSKLSSTSHHTKKYDENDPFKNEDDCMSSNGSDLHRSMTGPKDIFLSKTSNLLDLNTHIDRNSRNDNKNIINSFQGIDDKGAEEINKDASSDTVINSKPNKIIDLSCFKRMVKLNFLLESIINRKPVFAWENALDEEESEIRMLLITWNLNEECSNALNELHALIKRDIQHSIYIISLQNCSNLAKWNKYLKNLLGDSYVINFSQYGKLSTLFVCRRNILDSSIVSNILFNRFKDAKAEFKALIVSCKINTKTYCFVNCFFTSKKGKKMMMDDDLPDIVKIDNKLVESVSLISHPYKVENLSSYEFYYIQIIVLNNIASPLDSISIEETKENNNDQKSALFSKLYDICVFMGGFNSPIIGTNSGVISLINLNYYECLMKNDKMQFDFKKYEENKNKTESHTNNELFFNENEINYDNYYHEGTILFAPTSKFIQSTDSYNTTELIGVDCNIGWTDRIIWTKNNCSKDEEKEYFKQMSYDSNNLIKLSENRPVFSQFSISY